MSLGWKFLLPVMPAFGLILFGVNLVLAAVLVLGLDRGRMISPAYRRLDARRLAALRRTPAAQEGGD
jgi:hypothetical protein